MQPSGYSNRYFVVCLACLLLFAAPVNAAGPLSAKVTVNTIAAYSGGSPLPKPERIQIYDFDYNAADVQVDKAQSMRPRHMLTGDKNPDSVGQSASKTYYQELAKTLAKSGIAVEHMAKGVPPSPNALVIQGSYDALKEGQKVERETIGMGAGGADLETTVHVQLKTPTGDVAFLDLKTTTSPAQNVGAAVPVAAGLNPAAAAAKATVGDRKKTLNAYASKTAEATGKEVLKYMANQGWVKLNDKGNVAE